MLWMNGRNLDGRDLDGKDDEDDDDVGDAAEHDGVVCVARVQSSPLLVLLLASALPSTASTHTCRTCTCTYIGGMIGDGR